MGAYSGALGLLVNILRNLLLKAGGWPWVRSRVALPAIILLLLVMTLYTWAGWISLLPFVSVTVTCTGYWRDNAKKLRLSQLLGSPCTLLYDVVIRSWSGLLGETIGFISTVVSLFRFDWSVLNKKDAAC